MVIPIFDAPLASVAALIDLRETLEQRGSFDPPSGQWAYRGQPRDFNSLMPSFQRQFSQRSFGAARIIEMNLIEAFRMHYGKLNDRSADMPQPEQIGSGHDLRCLSVMQYYEIPTPLLDWTADFWTALYFACASDPANNAEFWFYDRGLFFHQRELDPSLAALMDKSPNPPPEPRLFDDEGFNGSIIELDPQISPRMRQQFAHHTVSTGVFSDHASLLRSLDERSSPGAGVAPRVHRFLVEASCKSKVLQFLTTTMNINAGTIFPDVVGLGRFLRWQFDSLRTVML